jgi:hypothetical protein
MKRFLVVLLFFVGLSFQSVSAVPTDLEGPPSGGSTGTTTYQVTYYDPEEMGWEATFVMTTPDVQEILNLPGVYQVNGIVYSEIGIEFYTDSCSQLSYETDKYFLRTGYKSIGDFLGYSTTYSQTNPSDPNDPDDQDYDFYIGDYYYDYEYLLDRHHVYQVYDKCQQYLVFEIEEYNQPPTSDYTDFEQGVILNFIEENIICHPTKKKKELVLKIPIKLKMRDIESKFKNEKSEN